MGFNLEDYEEVKDRLPKFYEKYPNGRVITDIIHNANNFDWVVIRAHIYRDELDQQLQLPLATGIAHEIKGVGGMANKNAHVENCETSAIGRALANIGMHGDKRPSREEMEKVKRLEDVSKKNTPICKKARYGICPHCDGWLILSEKTKKLYCENWQDKKEHARATLYQDQPIIPENVQTLKEAKLWLVDQAKKSFEETGDIPF